MGRRNRTHYLFITLVATLSANDFENLFVCLAMLQLSRLTCVNFYLVFFLFLLFRSGGQHGEGIYHGIWEKVAFTAGTGMVPEEHIQVCRIVFLSSSHSSSFRFSLFPRTA
jgi:hypothetical protein